VEQQDREHFAGLLVGIARGESRENAASVARDLLTKGWDDRFSESYLRTKALPSVIETLGPGATVDQALSLVENLVREYEEFSKVQVVTYPVANLTVGVSGVFIGDIELRPLDKAAIDAAEASVLTILQGGPNPPELGNHLVSIIREQFTPYLGGAVAEIRVVCQADIARDRARLRYDELLAFLNGAATLLYPLASRVRVAAPGALAPGFETVLVLSDPPEGFTLPMRRVGALHRFELDEAAVEKLRGTGYWEFAAVIAKPPSERSDFEAALISALHWYANHTEHESPANRLISLAIAAETIFPSRRGNIGLSTAEGVAFVLEDNRDRRFAARQAFRDLYAKRGAVAHRGRTNITDNDVYEMANIVIGVLLSLISRRNEFRSPDELDEWIDQQRLA
jgi:hypothetical protein